MECSGQGNGGPFTFMNSFQHWVTVEADGRLPHLQPGGRVSDPVAYRRRSFPSG